MIPIAAHGWMAEVSQVATGSLIAAVWQGILLVAAAGLGLRLLPKTPAAVRFAIWFGVFVVVMGLPAIALWPQAARGASAGARGPWVTVDARWSLAIALVWAVASLVRAGTLVVAAFRVRALWRRATPVGTSYRSRRAGTRELPEVPGFLRRAQLCVSDEVDRPTVIGFFAPKILIPAWLLEKLSPAELEQIVLHEASHLGRADDWMNLLQKIALVIFPLNPALAWVERRLCFERELACDERVLRATGAPKAYAACLATLAEHRLGRRGVALALGALGRESELARRVGRILRCDERMRPLHAKLVLGAAMLGLLGGVVGLERCPQLVGFAAKPGIAETAIAKTGNREQRTGTRAAASGYGYKNVVFRPAEMGSKAEDARSGSGLDRRFARPISQGLKPQTLAPVMSGLKPGPISEANAAIGTRGALEASAAIGARAALETSTALETRAALESRAALETGVAGRAVGGRLVQWVEVRSWENADGSRLVMTTVRTSSDVEGLTVQGRAASQQRQADGEQPQSDQVHPYAAVPVQGGWLVFQL